ncbi:hypothetical protein GNE10_03255 [Nostoc sp. 2RC]|nr:hypothetical protein [Nostoc sp. 2RC]
MRCVKSKAYELWRVAGRKKHSLKTVSAAQLEEAISKALSELLDYPHEVKIEHIEYAESLRGSQLRLAVNQGYKEEKREGSEPDEPKVPSKRESSLSGLELQWQEEAELVQWFEIAKNKGIAVASQRDRFSQQGVNAHSHPASRGLQ